MAIALDNPWDAFEAVGTIAPPAQFAQEQDPWDEFEPVGVVARQPTEMDRRVEQIEFQSAMQKEQEVRGQEQANALYDDLRTSGLSRGEVPLDWESELFKNVPEDAREAATRIQQMYGFAQEFSAGSLQRGKLKGDYAFRAKGQKKSDLWTGLTPAESTTKLLEIPVRERDKFLQVLADTVQQENPIRERDQLALKGFGRKGLERVLRGTQRLSEMPEDFARWAMGLPNDDREFVKEAHGIIWGLDPAKGASWAETGFLGALEMVPAMTASLATGGAAGAGTIAAGGSARLAFWANNLAATGFWYAESAPDIHDELKRSGAGDNAAYYSALFFAAPYAAIEQSQMVMLKMGFGGNVFKKWATKSFMEGVAKFGVTQGALMAGEVSEETLQQLTEWQAKEVARYFDKNVKVDRKEEWEKVKDATVEAINVMPFLMGPGAAVSGTSMHAKWVAEGRPSAGESAARRDRLEIAESVQGELQAERSVEQVEVGEWVAENPEAARELAALDKPTRTQFESFAPVVKETTAKGRVKWVDRVRRELAAQDAAEVAPEAAEEPAEVEEAPKPKTGLGRKKAKVESEVVEEPTATEVALKLSRDMERKKVVPATEPAAPAISAEEKADLFATVPDLADYNATELREFVTALSQKRTKAGKPIATTKAETARLATMSEDQLLQELRGVFAKPKEKVKPVRPEKTGLGKKKAAEKSSIVRNIETDIQTAVDAVPVFKDAQVEVVDAKGGVVKITRPDGAATTVHFRADAEVNAAEKELGTGAKRGAYAYGDRAGLKKGHIYLRKGASHQTLNHEAIHWLEDMGVVTAEEVAANGGREGIAEAYEKWVAKKTPNTLFEKIYAAIESLLSSQKRLFRDIAKRGLGRKKAKKAGGEQDVAFAEETERDPGYIRAKASTDQQVRDALRAHEKQMVEAGIVPPRRTWKKANEDADRMLSPTNYAATKARLLDRVLAGEMVATMEDQVAVDRIVEELQQRHIREGTVEAAREAELWTNGNFQGRARGAGVLGRRDPLENPEERRRKALMEAFYSPKKQTKRSILKRDLNAPMEPGDSIDQAREGVQTGYDPEATIKGKNDKAREKLGTFLEGQGYNVADINDIAKSPTRALGMLRQIRAYKASRLDAAYEYWHQMILSGQLTQIVNFAGTLGHGALAMGPERLYSATVNLIVKDPNAAQFGEVSRMIRTLGPGIKRGIRNGLHSFKHEVAGLEWELGAQDIQRQDERGFAIAGTKGKIVRIPGYRSLQAADAFTKSIIYEAELAARAYRTAKAEGLDGKAMDKRIAEIQDNPGSAESLAALAYAQEIAYQDKGGKTTQKIKRAALAVRRVPGLRYLVPFVNTPVNIAVRGGWDRTPFGIITTALEYRDARETGDYRRAVELSGRLLAWVPIWMALALGGDEDEPWITGAEGSETEGSRQARHRGIEPFTMRVPFSDARISYKRIEPIATSLGLAVDWINAFKSGDPDTATGEIWNSLVNQFRSKTPLQGLGDFSELFETNNKAKLASWGSGFTASWVPNLIRQPIRQFKSEFPDRRIWGKGDDWKTRVVKRAFQKTELPQLVGLVEDQPIYDLWGRKAVKNGPETTVPWQIARTISRELNPADFKVPDIFVGDRIIGEYNRTHPEENPYQPVTPAPYYTHPETKKKTWMTDEQKSSFTQFAGETSKLLVEKHNLDPENVTTEAVEVIRKSIEDSRKEARKQFAIQWTGGKAYDKTPEELAAMLHKKYEVAQRRLKAGYEEPQAGKEYQRRLKEWNKKKADARAYLTQLAK